MPDQKPTLEYGKRPLPRAPLWAIFLMALVSAIVGTITGGAIFFAYFHQLPMLANYDDTVEHALALAGLMICMGIAAVAGLAATWGRRYR